MRGALKSVLDGAEIVAQSVDGETCLRNPDSGARFYFPTQELRTIWTWIA